MIVSTKFSPMEIEMALHYYCRRGPFPDLDCVSQTGAMERFIDLGIMTRDRIEAVTDDGKGGLWLTKAGVLFVQSICNTPAPKKHEVWQVGNSWFTFDGVEIVKCEVDIRESNLPDGENFYVDD